MSTVLNVKIDPTLKKQAQKTAKELGLPMSIVVAASLRQFISTRSLTISDPVELSPDTMRKLKKMRSDAKSNKNLSPSFTDIAEAKRWLEL